MSDGEAIGKKLAELGLRPSVQGTAPAVVITNRTNAAGAPDGFGRFVD